MARKKGKKAGTVLLILILVPLLIAAGYAISTGSAGAWLQQWFGPGGSEAGAEDDDEAATQGETGGQQPGEDEETANGDSESGLGDKDETDPEQERDQGEKVPVIYVGQVLTIPGAGSGSSSASRVITTGVSPAGGKQIALTFDSGWEYTHTIPLLNTLDLYGVKATFFPRALWLKDHPDLGREIARRGHTIGNHSLTHPHMTGDKMSADDIRTELRQSTQIVRDVCGTKPYLFRPPYGEYDDRLLAILAEEGYPYTIMWTIDTLDWNAGNTMSVGGKETYIDVDTIVNRVLGGSDANKDSGIVLMHIGGETAGHLTVPALPRIIEGLQEQGYSFTTIDKMLPPISGERITYTVQKGDTLYSIGRRYGVSVQQLIDANNL